MYEEKYPEGTLQFEVQVAVFLSSSEEMSVLLWIWVGEEKNISEEKSAKDYQGNSVLHEDFGIFGKGVDFWKNQVYLVSWTQGKGEKFIPQG